MVQVFDREAAYNVVQFDCQVFVLSRKNCRCVQWEGKVRYDYSVDQVFLVHRRTTPELRPALDLNTAVLDPHQLISVNLLSFPRIRLNYDGIQR